ncbi:MAG: universal stress protein [Proteobacteria bacterium]|nr:universal stress protein [Pseudomonadota bacterium]
MSYKTILLHLDDDPRREERLTLAFETAERFDAHLVGLYVPGLPLIPPYAMAEAGPAVVEVETRRRAAEAASAEAVFRAASSRHRAVKCEWRRGNGDPVSALCLSARYADLVIAGQPEPKGDDAVRLPPGFAGDLVLSAGRPVLFVPYAGRFPAVGKRVMVAWNAGREAARALHDALPLLKDAGQVDVVAFDPGRGGAPHGEVPGADIGLYLARHGIKVTVSQQAGTDLDVGAQILSRAADLSADLIVMGAYGHSRVREQILGGATRTLLEAMTVPVLMSH